MRELIYTIVFLFELAIIGRVILSWFPMSSSGARSVMELLIRITEPVLGPVRRVLPSFRGFDLSPIVVILVLNVLLRAL
ncbi:MAG: YggT family protein [Ilumatobacteraceae bacterium]